MYYVRSRKPAYPQTGLAILTPGLTMYMAIASKAVTNMTLNAFDFHHPGKHLFLALHATFIQCMK